MEMKGYEYICMLIPEAMQRDVHVSDWEGGREVKEDMLTLEVVGFVVLCRGVFVAAEECR